MIVMVVVSIIMIFAEDVLPLLIMAVLYLLRWLFLLLLLPVLVIIVPVRWIYRRFVRNRA
jgi:hypothetical protein